MKQFFIKFEYTKDIHGGEIFKASDSVRVKAHSAKEAAELFKKEHKNFEHLEIVDVHEFHKRTNEFKREMNSTAASVTHDQLIEAETLLEEEIVENVLNQDELDNLDLASDSNDSVDATDYANVSVEINDIVEEATEEYQEDEVEVEEYNTVMQELETTKEITEETVVEVVNEAPVVEETPVQEEVVEETPVVEATAPIQEESTPVEETVVEETPVQEEVVEETPLVEEVQEVVEEAVESDSLEDLLKEIIFNSGISHSVEFIDGKQTLVLRKDGNVIAKTAISNAQKEKLNNL